MQYSEYYAMKKPEDTDLVNPSDFNDNTDTIDGQLHEINLEIAELSSDVTAVSEDVAELNSEVTTIGKTTTFLTDEGKIVTDVEGNCIHDGYYCLQVRYSDGTQEYVQLSKITSDDEVYYDVPIMVRLKGVSWEDFTEFETNTTLDIASEIVDGEYSSQWSDGTYIKTFKIQDMDMPEILSFQGTIGYTFNITFDGDLSASSVNIYTTADGNTFNTHSSGAKLTPGGNYAIIVIEITYEEATE